MEEKEEVFLEIGEDEEDFLEVEEDLTEIGESQEEEDIEEEDKKNTRGNFPRVFFYVETLSLFVVLQQSQL